MKEEDDGFLMLDSWYGDVHSPRRINSVTDRQDFSFIYIEYRYRLRFQSIMCLVSMMISNRSRSKALFTHTRVNMARGTWRWRLEDDGAPAWWHFADDDGGHTDDRHFDVIIGFPLHAICDFWKLMTSPRWWDRHATWRTELYRHFLALPTSCLLGLVCSSTCPRTHHNFVFVL